MYIGQLALNYSNKVVFHRNIKPRKKQIVAFLHWELIFLTHSTSRQVMFLFNFKFVN